MKNKKKLKEAVILLVEDRHLDIELTLHAFKNARLTNRVHVAKTGPEALDYLFHRGAYEDPNLNPIPDLILLDLKLPGLSGIEVLKQLKAAPLLKRIPVIVLTSSAEEFDRANCYDEGANSYLIKPVAFDGFTRVIEEIQSYWLTLNVEPPLDGSS